MKLKIHFSHKEELWNTWSHAGGILMGVVVGAIFLYWCFTMHNGSHTGACHINALTDVPLIYIDWLPPTNG